MIKLVKKRYKECDPNFISNEAFLDLLRNTEKNMQTDSNKTFVHLRKFLNVLKEHRLNKVVTNISVEISSELSSLSEHRISSKGTKRPACFETPDENNQPLKHLRCEELNDLSADEEYESCDSGNEAPKIIRKSHSKQNTESGSSSLPRNNELRNQTQNWKDFRFKKSVMSSLEAAASSFSSRLSKTVSKAKSVHTRTLGLETDSAGTSAFNSDSSLSRTPSPSFSKICKNNNQQSDTDLAIQKHEKAVENIGFTEVSSTTLNEGSDIEDNCQNYSSSRVVGPSSCKTFSAIKNYEVGNSKEKPESDVKLSNLEEEINGYTVEMNVSSDEDDVRFQEDLKSDVEISENNTGYLSDETVDSTKTEKVDLPLKLNKRDVSKNVKVPDVPNQPYKRHVNGKRKEKIFYSSQHEPTNHPTQKFSSHESAILIETDDESTASETEEMKKEVLESCLDRSSNKNEVDILFEDSDNEPVSMDGIATTHSKIAESKDNSERKFEKNETSGSLENDKNISADKELIKFVSQSDLKEVEEFPAMLGLVSVSKLKKECMKNSLIVSLSKIDEKTKQNYQDVVPSTSKDKNEDRYGKAKPVKKGSKRQIEELEKLLEQIRDKIEEVREHELSLDELDNETSDYIFEDKLKKKFVTVFKKLCQLHKTEATTGRPTEKFFRYEGTRYPDVNRKITRFINRRQEFPDYQDIRKLIIRVNKSKGLNLRKKTIDDVAREAFTDVGHNLQKRRHKDFIATFNTPFTAPLSEFDDPALLDPELNKKLESNRKDAKTRMDANAVTVFCKQLKDTKNKVLEKYTQLQYKLGDRDNEDDDDEDDEDVNSNNDENDGDDLIVFKDGDVVQKVGLSIVSRSGGTPFLMESSQVEIVNDEEEDHAPYFIETQIDDVTSPSSDVNIGIRPKSKKYENETLMQTDDDTITPGSSESEKLLSPSAVKFKMDEVLDVFRDCDEIEIVTDCSESEDEENTYLDSKSLTDSEVTTKSNEESIFVRNLKAYEPSDSSPAESMSLLNRKETSTRENENETGVSSKTSVTEIGADQQTLSHTELIKAPCHDEERAKAVSATSDLPLEPCFISKENRQDHTDRITEYIDQDLNNLAKKIATESTSDSDSDSETKKLGNTLACVEKSETLRNNKPISDLASSEMISISKSIADGEKSIEEKNITELEISQTVKIHKTKTDIENFQTDKSDRTSTNLATDGRLSSDQSNIDTAESEKLTKNTVIPDLESNKPMSSAKSDAEKSVALSTEKYLKMKTDIETSEVLMGNKIRTDIKIPKTSAVSEGVDRELSKPSKTNKAVCHAKQSKECTIHKHSNDIERLSCDKCNPGCKSGKCSNKTLGVTLGMTNKYEPEVICLDQDDVQQVRSGKSDSPCIIIDNNEEMPVQKAFKTIKVEAIDKSKISGKKSTQSSVMTTSLVKCNVKTADESDSDVEIVEEYNINGDEYYPNEPLPEEENNQDLYFDDNSSKNLNYDADNCAENSMEWEEDSLPMDSTSKYVNSNENDEQYENEISSTLADVVDIKMPSSINQQFRSVHVTLKRPVDRKPPAKGACSFSNEENLELIEIYDEPDSTPCVDDTVVSSSGQNEPIVLSDSE